MQEPVQVVEYSVPDTMYTVAYPLSSVQVRYWYIITVLVVKVPIVQVQVLRYEFTVVISVLVLVKT